MLSRLGLMLLLILEGCSPPYDDTSGSFRRERAAANQAYGQGRDGCSDVPVYITTCEELPCQGHEIGCYAYGGIGEDYIAICSVSRQVIVHEYVHCLLGPSHNHDEFFETMLKEALEILENND